LFRAYLHDQGFLGNKATDFYIENLETPIHTMEAAMANGDLKSRIFTLDYFLPCCATITASLAAVLPIPLHSLSPIDSYPSQ